MVFEACPISAERRNERVVRVVAGLVVAIVVAALALGRPWTPWLLLALGADFAVRGFGSSRHSPLATAGRGVANILRLAPKPVDAAPKKFAARIGVVFSAAAGLLFLAGLPAEGLAVGAILVFCAVLEAGFAFCVGCKVYSLLPRPIAEALAR